MILNFTRRLLPFFRQTNHTPNIITTYSVIFKVISLVCLWYRKAAFFALSFLIAYVFDCMDGQYARTYQMTSEFGDLYDHVSDLLVIVGLITARMGSFLFTQNPDKRGEGSHGGSPIMALQYRIPLWWVGVYFVFVAMLTMHAGCQQKNQCKKDESNSTETLDVLHWACPNAKWVKYTRWGGFGTFILIHRKKKKKEWVLVPFFPGMDNNMGGFCHSTKPNKKGLIILSASKSMCAD